MYVKTALYILPKTMMTQMLVLKWMMHFILITCTIPSYAVLPNITNRTVDGDVRRRSRRVQVLKFTIRNSGVDLRSSVFSFGVLSVSLR